jgi:DNA-binding transcriptional ArsR family regulator
VLHPVRLRVVETLYGRELTAKEIHQHLDDVPVASLYRHIDRLINGGVIEVIDERQVRGGVERTLRLVDAGSLGPDDFDSMAAVGDGFRLSVGALLAQADRYFGQADGRDVAAERVGIRQLPVWMSDEEFDEFLSRLSELAEEALARPDGPNRRRRRITLAFLPED